MQRFPETGNGQGRCNTGENRNVMHLRRLIICKVNFDRIIKIGERLVGLQGFLQRRCGQLHDGGASGNISANRAIEYGLPIVVRIYCDQCIGQRKGSEGSCHRNHQKSEGGWVIWHSKISSLSEI